MRPIVDPRADLAYPNGVLVETLPFTLRSAAAWRLSLLHSAADARMIWITAGQSRCLLGGRRRGVGAHCALFIPQGEPFALLPGPAANGVVVHVQTPETRQVTDAEPAPGSWPQTPLLLRVSDKTEQIALGSLLEALQREQGTRKALFEAALCAHGSLLAVWLHRQIGEDGFVPPRETSSELISAAFLHALVARPGLHQSVGQIAKHLGLTATHVSRVCKAQLGATAAELRAQNTVWAARNLLERTRLPSKDIAAQLGFGASASFSRFMQTHTGRTPLALRRAAQQVGAQRSSP